RLNARAITVKELCTRYLEDAENGLVLGKGERPKKASTIYVDKSRIRRHIVPLLGTRRVRDLTPSDINRFIRDVMSGKTKADVKTKKRGRAIVRGGPGNRGTWGRSAGRYSYLRHREGCHREESCPRRPETSRSRQDPPAQRGGVSRAW